jgi:hypothetical protein
MSSSPSAPISRLRLRGGKRVLSSTDSDGCVTRLQGWPRGAPLAAASDSLKQMSMEGKQVSGAQRMQNELA